MVITILRTAVVKSHTTPDVVYVPMKWSLRFYVAQYVKSHTTPDIVYVPIKWSLRFYVPRYVKSHTTPDIVYVPTKWSVEGYRENPHIYFLLSENFIKS